MWFWFTGAVLVIGAVAFFLHFAGSQRLADSRPNADQAAVRPPVVDRTSPPPPVLTQKPADPTPNTTNSFAWTDAEAGVGFECALESGAWATCATPYSYLIEAKNNGQHQFAVRAVDGSGNISAATRYQYKYFKDMPAGLPFQMSGSVGGMTLGVWQPIAVHISNPNSVAIFVSAITVTIGPDSSPSGCLTGSNVELRQSTVSPSRQVAVPAHGSVTLPAQAAAGPEIRLINLARVNQDMCKGKAFSLSYSGTATN
ncbi:MAG: hypothetical protein ACOH1Y_10970 [Propionicimonas sp.]